MDLIIDGNALLNVTVNVVVSSIRYNSNFDLSYVVVDGKTILKDSSKQMFRNFMLKYLTSIITPLRRSLNYVYFAFDATSWRKFYVEKHFQRHAEVPGFKYKGHKKTDDHKRELFMFFDYFHEGILPEFVALEGVHAIRVKGSEGDDIIAVLNDVLECDKVIWTVDSDMSQLVRRGPNFTIIMGNKNKNRMRKLVLPHGYDKGMTLADFSVDNYGIEQFAKYLIAEKEYEPLVVEPNSFTMRKIIMGDLKSDNIPGIYVRVSATGRRMGITDAKADKILSELESEFESRRWMDLVDSKDEAFISKVVDITARNVNANAGEIAEMPDNFRLNCRLIRLSQQMIPREMTNMIKYKYSQLDKSKKFNYTAYLDYAYINE